MFLVESYPLIGGTKNFKYFYVCFIFFDQKLGTTTIYDDLAINSLERRETWGLGKPLVLESEIDILLEK